MRSCDQPHWSSPSWDIPISPIKQSCPMVCDFPQPLWWDQTQPTLRDAGRMHHHHPVVHPSFAKPLHAHRDSAPQLHLDQNFIAPRQARLLWVCQIQRESLRSLCLLSLPCQGAVTEPRGPGKWPQAGSEQQFPKAQL